MVRSVVILSLLPILVECFGDGNIHLLQEEVAAALKTCSHTARIDPENKRQKRLSEHSLTPRIDANTKENINPYDHERRNTQITNQVNSTCNSLDYDSLDENSGGVENASVSNPGLEKINPSYNHDEENERIKRNQPLVNKNDTDQCLSQCVFANLQVVDSHGIPREAELWNKIQTSVTSQQSRVLLRDQTRACFQELQSESEDNGCSYSNKLERCLMLRLSDRKIYDTVHN